MLLKGLERLKKVNFHGLHVKKQRGYCVQQNTYKGSLKWKIAFTSQSLFQTESGLEVRKEMFVRCKYSLILTIFINLS